MDAIGDLARDILNLSIRLSSLEKDMSELKTEMDSGDRLEEVIAKAKAPKKRGRPAGSKKKTEK